MSCFIPDSSTSDLKSSMKELIDSGNGSIVSSPNCCVKVHTHTHTHTHTHMVPEKVTVFGDGVFKEKMKVK
jgi:hypothetical protein